ncbi:sensor histidine kinase KdpD [Halopseudomonas sp.]|uniref:sensor histidine kinase KdpD n=1 Tax=Halopseudomonas sp. TaxID=2901191 RepID=UPI00300156EE
MSNAARADALLSELPRQGRGKLKVFLGAAPGVGKTYAMLQAAHTQLRQGTRVLVGVVESHGRAETGALLDGLPVQPLKPVDYRGVTLQEMDLQAILDNPPRLLLVDELAHTNAPGSRHSKRWQDVQELLGAGIDVYTTVNVQHLEALNDQIRDITGVHVRETLPDWVVQEADEILLIDLPPRELLERLRDGKVYIPEQARAAIDAFFSQTNLTALRELAMQTAAAQVDADLNRRYRSLGQQAPNVLGRLLVAIDGDAKAERLVRHACRVAERRNLPWSVLHVDRGERRDEQRLSLLQKAQQIAERLGGEVVSLRGENIAATLIEHARARRASLLLIGRSQRAWWQRGFHRGLAGRLLAAGKGLEVSVLDTETSHPPLRRSVPPPVGRHYMFALLAVGLAIAAATVLARFMELPNISLVFLVAVLVVAVRSSLGPALVSAGVSFLAYNFLFIPPTLTLTIDREQDVLTLLFFLLMSGLTGNLASRQRRQLQSARDAQAETVAVLELSRKLTAATDRQAVLAAAIQHFAHWHDLNISIMTRGKEGVWTVQAGDKPVLTDAERAAADWAWQHGQPAGRGTDTLPSGAWWWLPLAGDEGPLAMLGAATRQGEALLPSQQRLLAALGQPLAQALQRARLAEELEAARLHGQTEELRSALLASVSHDLRTPLTAMRGSIDSLLELGEQIPMADRRELLEGTRNEAERLDRYIQNLLDMTRLGHGALALERDWVAAADVVGSALQRLRPVLAGLQLEISVPEELPLLYVHAALIEQALINVLENAARFSPEGGRLRVAVETDSAELRFVVADQGPGIPEHEREKVFDMFYTAARGDRGGQGTGLGLAICQGMLGAHAGRVSVGAGLDGSGASLILHLPLHAQPAMQEEPACPPTTQPY